MATPNVNTNPSEDPVQNYIDQIMAQYQAAEQYIEAMEHDATAIEHDQTQIGNLQSKVRTHWQRVTPTGGVVTGWDTHSSVVDQINKLQTDEQEKEHAIFMARGELERLDPSFASLDNTLTALLSAVDAIIKNGPVGGARIADDVTHIQKYLSSIFQAMKDKLKADMDQAIIQNNTQGQLSDEQLAQFAADEITAESGEQSVLSSLITTMSNDVVSYQKQADDAEADHARFDFLDDFASSMGFGDSLSAEEQDDMIEQNCSGMISGITAVMSALAPEMASVSPEFTEIQLVLNDTMKKLKEIIEDINLSPKEKQGKILSLMMFVLGFFTLIEQTAQSKKADNQKLMSQANMDASQMNMDDSITQQKIQEETEHNAKIMQAVMQVTQIILGSLMTLAAPGIGAAFLMALVTVLQATGALNSATDALADKTHSQIKADIIMGALEMGFTGGGGALLDGVIASATARIAEQAVSDALKTVADDVVKAAEKIAETVGGDAAKATAVIQTTVEKATELAAKKTVEQFFQQSFATLAEMIAKGTFKKALVDAVEEATEQAAKSAIKDSSLFAELAAKGISISEKEMETIANRAANEAVADLAKKSIADIQSQTGKSAMRKAITRILWTALYSLGSTNLIADIVKALRGKKQDDDSLLMAIQMIQSVITMLAQMGGCGIGSQTLFNGSPANLTRLANMIAMIPQAANVAMNFGQYTVGEAEAKAVEGIQMNGSVADVLHAFLEQLQKDGNLERDRFISMQRQELQSQRAMASRLHDGDAAGIQVLTSGAA